ncbi:MAG: RDD family protein [Candidatus Thiodiazotropha sp. (ex Notomyrtea botanica)]|nr:RDD family protein [Candidatus Thiodiazotropha sp. (ex Notomyrtea botanica)]
MEDNIYAPPKAALVKESNIQALASRPQRLFASLVDGITIMAITMPAMYFTGGFSGSFGSIQQSITYNSLIAILGIFWFFVLNGKLLTSKGQTIGKKVFGLQIVDMNGSLPKLKKHIIKRYSTYFLPAQIPFIGGLFSLINILFIFGKQKRCVHDYAANTKVIVSPHSGKNGSTEVN